MAMSFKPLDCARYGRLVPKRHVAGGWLCDCDCGAEKIVSGSHLRDGRVLSCGCLHIEVQRTPKVHGKRYTRTWTIWSNMLQRCGNSLNPSFKNYGGRGIHVCVRWHSFMNFLSDMGEAPDGLTIERRNNEIGYDPENCLWATCADQALNTRRNRLLTIGSETNPLIVWCRKLGVPYWTAHARLRRGASAEKALGLGGVH